MAASNSAALVRAIKSNMRLGRGWDAEFTFSEIAHRARLGELPEALDTAIYGIFHALHTGRVNGATRLAVDALTPTGAARLAAEVAVRFPSLGDMPGVPAYLMQRFSGE